MEMTSRLKKSGNSHYFKVAPEYVKTGLLELEGEYVITVKNKLETLEQRNKLLAERLKVANETLKEKGLPEIPMDVSEEEQKKAATKIMNDLVEKAVEQNQQKKTGEEARNSEGLTRTTDLRLLYKLNSKLAEVC